MELDSLSPKEFKAELARLAEEMRSSIEAGVEGFATNPKARAERVKRAGTDFPFFAATYFPHYIRGRLDALTGQQVPVAPSQFHNWLMSAFPKIINEPESVSQAIAAPRGEAKSTYVLIFLLWCFVTESKRYALLIMDAYGQAAVQLEAIKAELEFNPRLKSDFPATCGQGRVWREGEAITADGRKLEALGGGQRLRGRRHGAYRPDLILLDDIENDTNVASPEQRQKLHDWLNKAVENLGEAGEKMDIIYVGTILHYDSVLARTLDNKMWRSVRFQSILTSPRRTDLWDGWEATLKNDGPEAAQVFYDAHAAEMEEGATVSWPDKRPLLYLMKLRAKIGHDAFYSELQNDPVNSKDAPFGTLIYWSQPEFDAVYYGAVDPSLGKHGRSGDPSAILVGAYRRPRPEEMAGTLDVVEASIERRLPNLIIEQMIAYQRRYPIVMWFVESVQFQEFFRTQAMARALAQSVSMPCTPVTPNADKALRIASLQPSIADGIIRLHTSQKTLIRQMRHWPKADHDDGPDCLHILYEGAVSFGAVADLRIAPRHAGGGALSDYTSMGGRHG